MNKAAGLLQEPYRLPDVKAAEKALTQADEEFAKLLAGKRPQEAASSQGIDGFALLSLFNRYNELAETAEDLQRLDDGYVWASDAQSGPHALTKRQVLQRAQRLLPATLFSAFQAVAVVGATPETFKLPLTRTSRARYGYDIGRYRRIEVYSQDARGNLNRLIDLQPDPPRAAKGH